MLISDYFIWGDDSEYSLRISSHYDCYFVTKSIVEHRMKNNYYTSDIWKIENLSTIKRYKFSIRNDVCTHRKIGKKSFKSYRNWIIKQIIGVLFKKNKYKFYKLKIIITGYIYGLVFNPSIEYVSNV